jgi:hypothetical protein
MGAWQFFIVGSIDVIWEARQAYFSQVGVEQQGAKAGQVFGVGGIWQTIDLLQGMVMIRSL